jgi:hypothetical protein
MLKPKVLTERIKKMHKYVGKNSYTFSRTESELPPPPKSMFLPHLFTVMGSTPVFVVGSVMAASSVLEWGIPLVAASVAGVTAPFVVGNKRRKRYREELTTGLNTFLPQVVFSEMPQLTTELVTALDNGYHVEIPLNGGGVVSIKLGKEYYMKQPDVAGSINVVPANNGIAEFDLLLRNLSDTNPDIARALNAASSQSAMSQKKAEEQKTKADQKPTIASYLARNLKKP